MAVPIDCSGRGHDFGVSWNTVCEIDIRRLKKLSRPDLTGLRRPVIDEVYLG